MVISDRMGRHKTGGDGFWGEKKLEADKTECLPLLILDKGIMSVYSFHCLFCI